MGKLCFVLLGTVVVLAVSALVDVSGWRTDNASTLTAPVARQYARVIGEARVTAYPGYDVRVGADFAGILAHVYVKEGDKVRAGDRLADFDASVQKAALAAAEARIREVQANINLAEPRVRRGDTLLKQNALSQELLDERQRDLDAARAQLQMAQAEAERLRAEIAHSVITAPITGTILARMVEPGELINRGISLFRLADLVHLRLTADIDEFNASSVQSGNVATITTEGYPGKTWSGQVEEIPQLITDRQLDPLDPAAPTDVGVVRVKVTLPPKHPFRLGQRVEVEITPISKESLKQ